MGRKTLNTIKKTVSMHPNIVEEVRSYAKKRTAEELLKESLKEKKK